MMIPYWVQVVLLSAAMFVSTFSLAVAPVKMGINKDMINKTQLVGAGLLVGASLMIIMPEGIVVLIAALSKPQDHQNSNPSPPSDE